MYTVSIPVFIQHLNGLSTVLDKAAEVKPRSGFAIGNVRKVKEACFADSKQYKIRVMHEPEDDNKAHVALRRWPRDNEDLLELLAEEVWNSYVLNKDIPL